jgi:hypothetical protein
MHYRKDKEPRNKKNQRHGHWERYHSNGKLHDKGAYVNGNQVGQHITYWHTGKLLEIINYIDGKVCGYQEFNCGKHSETKYHAR